MQDLHKCGLFQLVDACANLFCELPGPQKRDKPLAACKLAEQYPDCKELMGGKVLALCCVTLP